jgi:cytochrome b pre-mRNA-processing protein 3
MLASLFARLTADRTRGSALFASVVAETRQPHWYVEGEVPDTVDGRWAVLATVTALALVRLEENREAAVALTERFIDTLDTELREMGVGDPSLGKQVRKLVGGLESRTLLWEAAVRDSEQWSDAVVRSLYRGEPPAAAALKHSEAATRDLWAQLERSHHNALIEGQIG